MLVVATYDCWKALKEGEGTTVSEVDTDILPVVTIPLIHVACEQIRDRIAFVKEAFSLKFSISDDHSTLLDNAMKNPRMCYRLRNIDFEIFVSIIQKCFGKVSQFLQGANAIETVDFVYKCQYLIEENLSLFYKDFSKQLDSLRFVF